MKKIKEISRSTKIIIYGAAGNGMRGYHSLVNLNGYNVIGFLDKRAQEVETQYGLPVWLPNSDIPFEKHDCVVCICIKNVFEHASIVNSLIQNGYRYFIFKPIGVNGIDVTSINSNYDKIFCDANRDLLYNLDSITELDFLKINDYSDRALIKANSDEVIAAIPFESIYTLTTDWKTAMKDTEGLTNSLSLVPQIKLFQLFNGSGDEEGKEIYLSHCASTIKNSENKYGEGGGSIKDTPLWRKSIMDNRADVYNKMNESLELGYSFFVDNAPLCELGTKNRLLIKSAKHRLAFFIAKKRKYIPVKIQKNEYDKFVNSNCAEKIQSYIDSRIVNGRIKVPIQHPMFYTTVSDWPNFFTEFVYSAVLEISALLQNNYELDHITVCDALDDYGSIARYMNKMGFNTIWRENSDDADLSVLLDELMSSTVKRVSDIKSTKDIDILFVDEERFDPSLCSNIRKMFFYIYQGNCPNVEGFNISKSFSPNIVNGNIRKMALYTREDWQIEKTGKE